jgi:thioredoxin reductase (NADPH)
VSIKPVILTVDDEPEVLNAIERDLRRRYAENYRIVKAGSGSAALEATRKLKERNTPIALFVSDERMPQMSGTEMLTEAIKIYPDARKVLLTAYADTQAAITGINRVGLDQYLLKPWDPPTEQLYPVLDDLLEDWSASFRPPFSGIRVVGVAWSPATHTVKDFLSRHQIPYEWVDIDQDDVMRSAVEGLSPGARKTPVVFFPDGAPMLEPTAGELAERLGMQRQAAHPFYDLVVIGAGPSGLAASVYGGSEGLKTLLVEGDAPGGQAGTSSAIENYLGFPNGIAGADLARRAATQARRFGTELVVPRTVTAVRPGFPYHTVALDDGSEVACYSIIVATGMSVRRLEVPGVSELTGAGVYYGAALSEAAACRSHRVFIVGGANSAGQAAMLFSRYAKQVTMVVRADSLAKSMSQYLVDRIVDAANIDVLTEATVESVTGAGRLETVNLLSSRDGSRTSLPAEAMFIFIGAAPRSNLLQGLVELDPDGYVLCGPDLLKQGKRPKGWTAERDPFLLETSIPGIFAAGDVRHGSTKRVASAVGEGSSAVGIVHRYLATV